MEMEVNKIRYSITKYHFIQSIFAGLFITLIILIGESFSNNVINAAIGSSVALVFLHPKNAQNNFKSLVGGNCIAILSFLLLYFIFSIFNQELFVTINNKDFHIFSGLSLTLCLLLMSISDTEHIPAAGTSIGLSVHNFDFTLIVFILISILSLYLLRVIAYKYGKNIF
jgi:hypothetical protein